MPQTKEDRERHIALLMEALQTKDSNLISTMLKKIPTEDADINIQVLHALNADTQHTLDFIERIDKTSLVLQDFLGRTPLHYLVEKEGFNEVLIQRLIRKAPGSLLLQDNNGNTPLHLIASRDEGDCIRRYIDEIPSEAYAIQNNLKETPLHIATKTENIGIVPTLLTQMDLAMLELKNKDDKTALETIPIEDGLRTRKNMPIRILIQKAEKAKLETEFQIVEHGDAIQAQAQATDTTTLALNAKKKSGFGRFF